MVPFIDVMLVLLIIFMVTAPLITTGVVDLPSVGRSQQRPAKVVEVVVGADEKLRLRVDQQEPQGVALAQLASRVLALQAGNADVPVVISADRSVRYEHVVRVMDTLQRAGVPDEIRGQAQVVNYIQWGVTNKLCDQMGPARAMHLARAKMSTGIFNLDENPTYQDQSIMTDLGERFVELRREGKSLAEITETLTAESIDLDIMSSRPQSECAMTCQLTEREQKRLDLMEFGYIWEKLLPARARVKNRTGF